MPKLGNDAKIGFLWSEQFQRLTYIYVVFDSNQQAPNQIKIKTYGIHENFALLKKMLVYNDIVIHFFDFFYKLPVRNHRGLFLFRSVTKSRNSWSGEYKHLSFICAWSTSSNVVFHEIKAPKPKVNKYTILN